MKWIELPFAKFVGDDITYNQLFVFDRNGTINADVINYFLPSKYDDCVSMIFLRDKDLAVEIYMPYNELKEKLNTLN